MAKLYFGAGSEEVVLAEPMGQSLADNRGMPGKTAPYRVFLHPRAHQLASLASRPVTAGSPQVAQPGKSMQSHEPLPIGALWRPQRFRLAYLAPQKIELAANDRATVGGISRPRIGWAQGKAGDRASGKQPTVGTQPKKGRAGTIDEMGKRHPPRQMQQSQQAFPEACANGGRQTTARGYPLGRHVPGSRSRAILPA